MSVEIFKMFKKFLDEGSEIPNRQAEYRITMKNGKQVTKFLNKQEAENVTRNISSPKGLVKSIELVNPDLNHNQEGDYEKSSRIKKAEYEKQVEDQKRAYNKVRGLEIYRVDRTYEKDAQKLYKELQAGEDYLLAEYTSIPTDEYIYYVGELLAEILKQKSQNFSKEQLIPMFTNSYSTDKVVELMIDRGVDIYPTDKFALQNFITKAREDKKSINKTEESFYKAIEKSYADGGDPKLTGVSRKDVENYIEVYKVPRIGKTKLPLYDFFMDILKSNI